MKFLADVKPDIVCCQEVKTRCSLSAPGYLQYWNNAERAGYSGTLVLAKKEPLSVTYGMGMEEFDKEGRLITLEYKDYFVVNVYAPSLNPHFAPNRPDYRAAWDNAFREYVCGLPKPVVMNGELFPTDTGISYSVSLSPILSNMMLDGMQSYIYDRLYPDGNNIRTMTPL